MSEQSVNLGLNLDDLGEDKPRLIPKEGGNSVKIVKFGVTTVENKETHQPIEALEIVFVEKDTMGEFKWLLLHPGYVEEAVDEKAVLLIGRKINQLRHIAHGLLPKEEGAQLPKGITWKVGDTMKDLVSKIFANSIEKEEIFKLPCKIKTVYGKDSNFVNLPLFPPFFSTKNRPIEFSYNPDFDYLTPQGKKAQSEKGGEGKASGAKDLPFDEWD